MVLDRYLIDEGFCYLGDQVTRAPHCCLVFDRPGLGLQIHITLWKFAETVFSFSVAKNLEEIHNGSTLIKVRKNGKRYPRVYRMENDFLMFKQINSKKIVPLRKLTGRNYEKEKGKILFDVVNFFLQFSFCGFML